VDWWVSLKIPKTAAELVGKYYTYYDSTMTSNTWIIGTDKIDDLTVKSHLYWTLNQINTLSGIEYLG
jgi:hypothetical protein